MPGKCLRCLTCLLALLVSGGGCYHLSEHTDRMAVTLANQPIDVAPTDSPWTQPAPATETPPVTAVPQKPETDPPKSLAERLKIPPELPGSNAPPIKLPPYDPAKPKEREEAIQRLFPPLPSPPADVPAAPGPEGRPLTLADLQRLAMTNSPALRQAAADVEAARGAAVQAGLCPNPTIGYEGDTINQAASAGIQGAFVEQTIKTAGKLKLAQAAAAVDIRNAELALRRAQTDLTAQVRSGYFAVLVALENLRVARALTRFTDEVYSVQVEQLKGIQAATYEPLQLRVLALQARGNLVQARNRYLSAWKQLAAHLGLPTLPPTALTGRVDMGIPVYDYEQASARILTGHTDVLTAANSVVRARYLLRLAQLTPVPDVDVRLMVQKDYTTPPFGGVTSVVVSVPVPVWDRNQGNIQQAEGQLMRATDEAGRARNDLAARLAEAFERYDNNRQLLDYYRTYILPDQMRAYRGVYERHQQVPDKVSFGDIVNAQQTLANSVMTYVSTLGGQWQAVVDLAQLLQTDDLFQTAGEMQPAPIPCFDDLALPCK